MKRYLFMALFLLWAYPAWATTYYVSKTGNTTGGCGPGTNPSTPLGPTIESGVSCLSGGDTLYIRAGDYSDLHDSIGSYVAVPNGLSASQPTVIAGFDGDAKNCSTTSPTCAYLRPR